MATKRPPKKLQSPKIPRLSKKGYRSWDQAKRLERRRIDHNRPRIKRKAKEL